MVEPLQKGSVLRLGNLPSSIASLGGKWLRRHRSGNLGDVNSWWSCDRHEISMPWVTWHFRTLSETFLHFPIAATAKAQDARPGLTRRLTWHRIGGFRQPLTASSLHLPCFQWLAWLVWLEWLERLECWRFRNTELEFLDAPGFIPVGFGRRFTKDRMI